ncbi:MAG: ATPase [Sphingobacteriales bacterium]|nr:MAG: ATPase [Sphingobacteriales bacterium]
MLKNQIITKASGERTNFDVQKLKNSLRKSGADEQTIELIVDNIVSKLYENITTKEIYTLAFSMLRSTNQKPFAAKYKLKNAIMELGPSGYPFEKYFAEILKHQGYDADVSVMVNGLCVKHEIDILASFKNEIHFIECKYHNGRGVITDVKTSLYIKSRFEDVKNAQMNLKENKGKNMFGWVVTNTHFSDDAIKFGICSGLKLLGWNYPEGKSLKEHIDRTGLHPLTCLTTLTKTEKGELLDRKIVLCKEIAEDPNLLASIGISKVRIRKISEEATLLSK